jgi:uncharacterized short protein YbdD (DUF466 family)
MEIPESLRPEKRRVFFCLVVDSQLSKSGRRGSNNEKLPYPSMIPAKKKTSSFPLVFLFLVFLRMLVVLASSDQDLDRRKKNFPNTNPKTKNSRFREQVPSFRKIKPNIPMVSQELTKHSRKKCRD